MKKIISITFCFFLCFSAEAQNKWTLRQCIEYAQENNIEIKQQALEVENSEIELSTSKNSRLPDLSASAGYRLNLEKSNIADPTAIESLGQRVYVDNTNASGSFRLSSSTPLFSGFKISNDIRVKELNLKAAIEGLNKAKDNLELQITSLYLDVLFNKELLRIYEEQAVLTANQVEKTEVLVNSGKSPKSQLYDIKAQLANDEVNVTNAKNSLDLSLLNLAQALNLFEYEAFDVIEPAVEADVIKENLPGMMSPSLIYQAAIEIKPHIKEVEYKLESSKKSLKVAESAYWPSLSLDLEYGTGISHSYRGGVINESYSSQLKNRGMGGVMLSLNIPIFNRFQTRNQVRQAKLGITGNELALENVKLNLFKEIQQAYQNAVSAQSKYQSSEKAFEAAEESFKYAKDRYEVGKISVYEYSEAQLKVLKSKSEQLQAKYDFVFRTRILDFYAGKQIDI